jgi:hypothetical protein
LAYLCYRERQNGIKQNFSFNGGEMKDSKSKFEMTKFDLQVLNFIQTNETVNGSKLANKFGKGPTEFFGLFRSEKQGIFADTITNLNSELAATLYYLTNIGEVYTWCNPTEGIVFAAVDALKKKYPADEEALKMYQQNARRRAAQIKRHGKRSLRDYLD